MGSRLLLPGLLPPTGEQHGRGQTALGSRGGGGARGAHLVVEEELVVEAEGGVLLVLPEVLAQELPRHLHPGPPPARARRRRRAVHLGVVDPQLLLLEAGWFADSESLLPSSGVEVGRPRRREGPRGGRFAGPGGNLDPGRLRPRFRPAWARGSPRISFSPCGQDKRNNRLVSGVSGG